MRVPPCKPLPICLSLDNAHGVVALANANIDRAVRRVHCTRARPRQFTVVWPVVRCMRVASRLNIPRTRSAIVCCARGLLVADITRDYSRSLLGIGSAPVLLDEMLAQRLTLSARAAAEDMMFTALRATGGERAARPFTTTLMRYLALRRRTYERSPEDGRVG